MNEYKELAKHRNNIQEFRDHTDLIHSYPSYDSQKDEDEINLRELWQILNRRKGTIISITLLIFTLVSLQSFLTTPTYRSSVSIQVNPENSGQVLQYDVAAKQSNPYLTKDFYQTQYELLRSKSLARDVIDELDLESYLKGDVLEKAFWEEESMEDTTNKEDLFPAQLLNSFLSTLNEKFNNKEYTSKLGDLPLEVLFLSNLTVEPVKSSRLVTVHYDSIDPQLSTLIANTLAEKYIDMNLNKRVEAATYAEKFLKEQLLQAKSKLQESEENLVKYAKEKDIINTDEKQNLDSQTIVALNQALTEAEKDRIEIESNYEQLKSKESITRLQENVVIQTLKETRAKLQSEYQEKLGIYKPAYPTMIQLKQRIDEINSQIKEEIESENNALKADYLAAKQKENEIKNKLEQQKQRFLSFKDKSIQYNTLSREVETNRELYEGLLQRLKEVGVAGSIGSNNITIVDRASVPFSKHKPNTNLNMILGLILGLFAGVITALLLEFINNTIKSSSDIESLLKTSTLGIIPIEKKIKQKPLFVFNEPQSALAEAFRSLRTNLQFSTSSGIPKSLQITSSMPSEGKSSSTCNLGVILSNSGKSVLIIDCDLRKPSLHKNFRIDNSTGLSNFLTNQTDFEDIIKDTVVDNLHIITSGPIPPTPVELLSSENMDLLIEQAHKKFDIVLLDSPPVIGLSDALVLSQHVEATLFVVAYNQTKKDNISSSFKRLQQTGSNIIGSLFTKVKSSYGSDYTSYYYYYGNEKTKKLGSG